MKLSIREMALFAMFGTLMYASKLLMELLPNIHLIGVFTVAFTAVYRKKALYPIYIFVFITGLAGGFAPWWVAYLYIWTVLWGLTMLLPKKLPQKALPLAYMLLCSLHGFAFGLLYAPSQALLFGMNFRATLAWIAAGLPFDLIHGASNFFAGLLIYPLTVVLRKLEKATS